MAPPRKHQTDVILDATRALVLAEGTARRERRGDREGQRCTGGDACTTDLATATESSPPRGYALWSVFRRGRLRPMARPTHTVPGESAVATAVAAVNSFMREIPDDARLLVTLRPSDLLDGEPDAAFRQTLDAMNAPLIERVITFARELYGRVDSRCIDAVSRAVVDLPGAVVRRHTNDDPIPPWLEDDVAAASRALLTSFAPG